jgi:cytochrome P450
MFISVWNLHRSEELWEDPHEFRPMRKEFGDLNQIPNETTMVSAFHKTHDECSGRCAP